MNNSCGFVGSRRVVLAFGLGQGAVVFEDVFDPKHSFLFSWGFNCAMKEIMRITNCLSHYMSNILLTEKPISPKHTDKKKERNSVF